MKSVKFTASLFLLMSVALPATVIQSAPFEQYEVHAAGPEGSLEGSMVKAEDGAPLVLIIPGSGPTDRDGNNPLGVTAASYRLLAHALAEKGISTLRIDKRGMFGSATAIADANKVTIGDYSNDVQKWVDVGLKESGAKCVWLAGHSEGGLIALVTAQKADKLCGIILLASPGRNLADALQEQLRANPANALVLPDAEKAIAGLRNGQRVDVSAMHPALQNLFNPAVQGFLTDMFSHDPALLASKVKLPMMIVQGGRDIQVRASDAEALATGQPKAKLLTIETMTHALKHADGESRAASVATYTSPDTPVMPELVDAMAAFIKKK